RKYGAVQQCAIQIAAASSRQATTEAVGSWRAISMARLGPDTTATRSGGKPNSSAITSLILESVPSSRPFMRETPMTSCARYGFHALSWGLNDWAGTASTTSSAPSSTSAGAVEAVMLFGRITSFKYWVLVCRPLISSTTSLRRPQILTPRSTPADTAASARILAKVVPQEPAPRTATTEGDDGA